MYTENRYLKLIYFKAKGQELNFRSSSANKYYQPHSLYQYEEESEEEEDEQEEIIEFQYYFPQVDHRKYQSADFTPSNMRLKLIGEKEVLLERNHLTQAEQFSPGYSGDEDMEDSHQYKGSDNSSKSPLQNKITPQENIINDFKKLQKKQFIIKLITIELFILIKNIISYLILMIKIIITTCWLN